MDEVSKHRLTGAAVWLMLLVIIVPVWFSQPINFQPAGYVNKTVTAERPLVDHAYVLPESAVKSKVVPATKPKTDKQPSPRIVKKVVEKKVVAKSVVQKSVAKVTEAKAIPKSKPVTKTRWIVRIIAYRDIKNANNLLGRLESRYEVYIKTFEKSGIHSVRTGPYISKAKAEQDKKKLDKMLHTKSEVVQFK
ncbi:MAG: DedD protein [Thiomicrorhabdus sp.]|nr:MAG: DedD protein [Thiomicrorhabdus sp.]